jgi:hypothetical protein
MSRGRTERSGCSPAGGRRRTDRARRLHGRADRCSAYGRRRHGSRRCFTRDRPRRSRRCSAARPCRAAAQHVTPPKPPPRRHRRPGLGETVFCWFVSSRYPQFSLLPLASHRVHRPDPVAENHRRVLIEHLEVRQVGIALTGNPMTIATGILPHHEIRDATRYCVCL